MKNIVLGKITLHTYRKIKHNESNITLIRFTTTMMATPFCYCNTTCDSFNPLIMNISLHQKQPNSSNEEECVLTTGVCKRLVLRRK